MTALPGPSLVPCAGPSMNQAMGGATIVAVRGGRTTLIPALVAAEVKLCGAGSSAWLCCPASPNRAKPMHPDPGKPQLGSNQLQSQDAQ